MHTSRRAATAPATGAAAEETFVRLAFFLFDATFGTFACLFFFVEGGSESESSEPSESSSESASSSSSSESASSSSSSSASSRAGFRTGLAAFAVAAGARFSLDAADGFSDGPSPAASTRSTYCATAAFVEASSRALASSPRSASISRLACFMVSVATFARKWSRRA